MLSIHWGFSIGGVAQYASLLEGVSTYAPIEMSTVCILNRRRHIDEQTLSGIGNLEVIERKGPWDLSWIAKVRVLIRLKKPDLIFTHGFNGHFVALLTGFPAGSSASYVASYHGEYHPPTRLKKIVAGVYNGFTEYYMRRKASSIVSVADYCKRYLVSKKVDPDKVTVIHNGISDIAENNSAGLLREELGIPEGCLAIGVISRLDPEKGLRYLLEAFRGVAESYPDVHLVIIGTGSQESDLKRLAVDLKVERNITFTGFRSNASRYLSALDIFVLPSLAEYHSIGLLEAMRAGKAIVSTDVGGNTESVRPEKEGLVVGAQDSAQLGQALKRLIGSKELRGQFGKAARERFEREFKVETMVERSAKWLVDAANP